MADLTVQFYPRRLTIAIMVLVCCGFLLLFFAVADSGDIVRGLVIVPWIALFGFVWTAQLLTRGPVITVLQNGIRDSRFSPDVIPWNTIRDIGRKQKPYGDWDVLVLGMDEGIRRKFKRSVLRKLLDAYYDWEGFHGVYIGMMAVNGTIDELLAAIGRIAPPGLVQPIASTIPEYPECSDDPDLTLHNPPSDAEVLHYKGRRAVVLKDGHVSGELLTGRARWFASISEFKDFIGG